MDKIIVSLCLFFFSFSSSAKASSDHSGCLKFKNLPQSIVQTWTLGKYKKTSLANSVSSAPLLEIGQRADLTLLDSNKFKTIVEIPAEKKPMSGQKSFGGFAQIETSEKGDYAFGAKAPLWIEVIDLETRKSVAASSFEKQDGCDILHKAVRFPLKEHHGYVLQVTSSHDDFTSLIVVTAP